MYDISDAEMLGWLFVFKKDINVIFLCVRDSNIFYVITVNLH